MQPKPGVAVPDAPKPAPAQVVENLKPTAVYEILSKYSWGQEDKVVEYQRLIQGLHFSRRSEEFWSRSAGELR